MYKMSAFWSLFLLFTGNLWAQESRYNCSYYSNDEAVCEPKIDEEKDKTMDSIIVDLLLQTGLETDYMMLLCPGVYVCEGNAFFIKYDATYFEGIKGINLAAPHQPTQNPQHWVALAILAHEIAHHHFEHFSNRLVYSSKTQPDMELEADAFSGFVLYTLGATLQQAQLALQSAKSNEQDSSTHPSRSKRLEAVATGWNNARQRNESSYPNSGGITLFDTDGDGLANSIDRCPNEKGSNENGGCPDLLLTTLEFSDIDVDFGLVNEGEILYHTFYFTNTGNETLVIEDVKGSCGCVKATFNNEPVPSGRSGFIKAEFDTKGKKGMQTKTLTINANTDPAPIRLTIKAQIREK